MTQSTRVNNGQAYAIDLTILAQYNRSNTLTILTKLSNQQTNPNMTLYKHIAKCAFKVAF